MSDTITIARVKEYDLRMARRNPKAMRKAASRGKKLTAGLANPYANEPILFSEKVPKKKGGKR